jgi:hypothetical protein
VQSILYVLCTASGRDITRYIIYYLLGHRSVVIITIIYNNITFDVRRQREREREKSITSNCLTGTMDRRRHCANQIHTNRPRVVHVIMDGNGKKIKNNNRKRNIFRTTINVLRYVCIHASRGTHIFFPEQLRVDRWTMTNYTYSNNNNSGTQNFF